jgi:hypothetical protein
MFSFEVLQIIWLLGLSFYLLVDLNIKGRKKILVKIDFGNTSSSSNYQMFNLH